MFGMAGETPLDVRFNLFGIPIRIHPIFWLSGALLCWDPDRLDLVVLGILCVFVSVLVHELGHALVFRYYGWPSEIVLYFLGGYATATRLSTWRQIWSLAAGPLAGMSFAVLVSLLKILVVRFSPAAMEPGSVLSEVFRDLLFFGFLVNLMNLIPALPLDGGQIMAALVSHYGGRGRKSTELALKISTGAAGAVAIWCAYCMQTHRFVIPLQWTTLQPSPQFLMLFFGILAAQSLIEYNNLKSWR